MSTSVKYDTIVKRYAVRAQVWFFVNVETEIPVEHGSLQEQVMWNPESQIKMALIEEAKKKVAVGNCQAKLYEFETRVLDDTERTSTSKE